ncbi:MAG: cytochrome P450 [Erythrobacter sp.]
MRPVQPDYITAIDALVARVIDAAVTAGQVEVVRGFALPLQSRALTPLLGLPETAAEEWIGWGVHVFHDGDDSEARGSGLDRHIRARITSARAALCADSRRIPFAVEEFLRVTSPLTHIGRVCPAGAEVGGHRIAPKARASLCWASANFDETVFDAPDEVRLVRAPNPHLGFGSGHHNCLGAAHARTLLRSLIRQLGARTRAITVLAAEPGEERYGDPVRTVGYRSLTVRIAGGAA